MLIFVKSKLEMRKKWYADSSWFNDKYFITIAGNDYDFAFPYRNKNVLRLVFDDITDEEYKDGLILFSNDDIIKIKNFINLIDNQKELYINCNAGISRSGAIGDCLNCYFNKDNREHYNLFFNNNKHIQPNPYIHRMLMKSLFYE